jgi:hypothetical protein
MPHPSLTDEVKLMPPYTMPDAAKREEDSNDAEAKLPLKLERLSSDPSHPSEKYSHDIEAQPPLKAEEPTLESIHPADQPPYTVMPEKDKIFTIIMASFAAFISPVSGSIYYPALNDLAEDLHVTVSTINLTITVYMVPIKPSSDSSNSC